MKIADNMPLKPNFKSGLNPKIQREIVNLDVNKLESLMRDDYGIDAVFRQNKAIAGGFAYIINLCSEAYQKYSLPFNYFPPRIRVFEPKDLAFKLDEHVSGFCTQDTGKVLETESSFEPCSIFIKNVPDDIKKIDEQQERKYRKKYSSSPHFLSTFLHEWMHNIHTNIIFYKYGYDGDCSYADALYNHNQQTRSGLKKIEENDKRFGFLKNLKIKRSFGYYASTSKAELFPEVMVKLITESIDPKTQSLSQNPIDKLKEYPKFIQKFIKNEIE